ncbi:MAG: hypothetical protein OXI13_06335 [Gammaproteobacteria bacterium]|nr:hypothetical protein [Gammaproteobacteria bacterium]
MNETLQRVRELETRQSELRQESATLSGISELNEEQRQRLDAMPGEISDNERQLRAARFAAEAEDRESIVAEDTGEGAEFREIRGRVRVGEYVAAAMEQRAAQGAELEYNSAIKVPGNELPLELLAPEHRTTTNTDSSVTQGTWLDRLFADTAAMHVGVRFQSVPSGVLSVPQTTAGASAAQRGRGEAVADAAWTVGVTEIKPARNSVRAVLSSEDTYRLPGLEAALRRELGMALTEGVDRAVFLGDAGANEDAGDVTGFKGISGLTEKTLTQANKLKADKTLELFLSLVDGVRAGGLDDLRIVSSVGANVLWESTILALGGDTASVFKTLGKFLRDCGLNWRARGEIETATSNGKFGAFIGLNRGIEGAAVAPVWASAQLIRDVYGDHAKKGEVALTLSHYWNFKLTRATNFARLKFVT